MARKRRQKSDKKVLEKPREPDSPKPDQTEKPEPENPFDFGGLPNRDLKKNLGCG